MLPTYSFPPNTRVSIPYSLLHIHMCADVYADGSSGWSNATAPAAAADCVQHDWRRGASQSR
jgi:hypothetical protein